MPFNDEPTLGEIYDEVRATCRYSPYFADRIRWYIAAATCGIYKALMIVILKFFKTR